MEWRNGQVPGDTVPFPFVLTSPWSREPGVRMLALPVALALPMLPVTTQASRVTFAFPEAWTP